MYLDFYKRTSDQPFPACQALLGYIEKASPLGSFLPEFKNLNSIYYPRGMKIKSVTLNLKFLKVPLMQRKGKRIDFHT